MNSNNTLKIHIGYWLSRLRAKVHQAFEDRLASYNVSVPAWCIMVAIYDQKASSISELANYIEVDKASISRVVEKLVAENLLNHKPGKDRRSGIIELSSKAEKLVPKLIEEAKQNELTFFGHLSSTEINQLRHIMKSIIANIPDMSLDGWLLDKNEEK